MLNFASLLEQLNKDRDFGTQNIGLDRFDDVVHGAERVAAAQMTASGAVSSQEDDWSVARLLTTPNQSRGIEAVNAWHEDVEQDDGHLMVEQEPKRIISGFGSHQVPIRSLQNGLQRQQVGWAVVDHQDVDVFFSYHRFGLLIHQRHRPI